MKPKAKRQKRGNGQGGVFKQYDPVRGERWVGCLSIRTLTGLRRRVRVYGKTAEEADKKLALKKLELLSEVRPSEAARETLGEYLTRWLEDVKPTIRISTWRSYEQLVRLHITPALGAVPMRRLSVRDVQWFLNAKGRARRLTAAPDGGPAQDGPTLSPRYVDYMRAVLRAALGDAVKQEILTRNVAALAESPKQRRFRGTWLTAEQAKQFVDFLLTPRPRKDSTRPDAIDEKRALYALALATGARQGELLALRWEDVDLTAGMLTIRHTLQRIEGKWRLVDPKTDESRRTIPIAPFALDMLRTHKQEQAAMRLALGPEWKQAIPFLVFTSATGGPLDGVNVTHGLKRRLKAAGLPAGLRFHDLRHSTASLLLKQGVAPRVVADVLGHSDVRLTLNTYSHVADEVRRDAVEKLDALFQTA